MIGEAGPPVPVAPIIPQAPPMGPRRVKIMMVNPADFMVLFKKGLKVRGGWKVIKGLPGDARLLTVAYDAQRGGILMVVESDEFELIPATQTPPVQQVDIEIADRHLKHPK